MAVKTLTLQNMTYAILPMREYQALKRGAEVKGNPLPDLPNLPNADEDGLRPAGEAVRTMIARSIINRRLEKKLSQKQLADLADIRQETLSRIETGKHRPQQQTLEKIGAVLD